MNWTDWAFSLRLPAKQKVILLFVAHHGNDGVWFGRLRDFVNATGLGWRAGGWAAQIQRLEDFGFVEAISEGELISITLKE